MKVCELIKELEKGNRTEEHLFKRVEEPALVIERGSDTVGIAERLSMFVAMYGPIRDVTQGPDMSDPLNRRTIVRFRNGKAVSFVF